MKLIVKASLVVAIIALIISVSLGLRAGMSLLTREHQKSIQRYEHDFKMIKAGDMDILDEYSKITNLRTSIKFGLIRSNEIGSNDVEISLLHTLSKERARTEIEKRMKDFPANSESFKSYQWLLHNLDDPE